MFEAGSKSLWRWVFPLALVIVMGVAERSPAAKSPSITVVGGAGEVVVSWDRAGGREALYYLIYRAEGRDPDVNGEPFEMVKGLRFVDTRVTPGVEYRYAVVGVERSGAREVPTGVGSARVVAAGGPKLTAVTVEPTGRLLKPGDVVTVSALGQSGAQAFAEVGTLAVQLPLREKGRTGRYSGSFVVRAADLGVAQSSFRVVAYLTDSSGSSDLAGPQVVVSGRNSLSDRTSPTLANASHDGWKTAGFSGKLVAGDVLTVAAEGEPGAAATFEIAEGSGPVEMKELRPGVYSGTYTVKWADQANDAAVVVRLADAAGNESRAQAGRPVSIDTRVRLTVAPRDALLAANGRAQTRVVVHATNANGDEVSGHPLDLSLAKSGELLADGGGGAPRTRRPPAEGDAKIALPWGGASDAFGDVSATLTASSSSGRVFVLAKDLMTGDVGVGWVDCSPRGSETDYSAASASRGRAGKVAGKATTRADEADPRAPTVLELRRAYGTVFVPTLGESRRRDRAKIGSWLVRVGDKVEKGQALVAVEMGNDRRVLAAPARGVLVKAIGREGERVEVGDVVGFVEIDETVWGREFARQR